MQLLLQLLFSQVKKFYFINSLLKVLHFPIRQQYGQFFRLATACSIKHMYTEFCTLLNSVLMNILNFYDNGWFWDILNWSKHLKVFFDSHQNNYWYTENHADI